MTSNQHGGWGGGRRGVRMTKVFHSSKDEQEIPSCKRHYYQNNPLGIYWNEGKQKQKLSKSTQIWKNLFHCNTKEINNRILNINKVVPSNEKIIAKNSLLIFYL